MSEPSWLDELISFCTDNVEEIPMPQVIPETCFHCGFLVDECVCRADGGD